MNWILIFVGGGLGSVSRYGLSILLKQYSDYFPWPTLVANVIAALFIGILYYSGIKNQMNFYWPFLATGFCGGLSTFSAFSLETFHLARNGNFMMAFMNVFLSFVCCLLIMYVVSKLIGNTEL